MEIRPPKVPENWDDVDLEQLPEIYKAYRQIPEKQRLPIDIALWRRSQAMNTWDDTNKAIDLGIALESVLTSPKTREQLSLHIRVLGSKLVSKDSNERSEIFLLLKCLYRIRSEAVHNGTVDKSYKIKNRGSVRTSEVLDEGIALLSRCIKEIIKRGGLTQDDFEALLIE
nr:HEPN domain-containing protein [Pseudidiomarina sediminum]